MRDGYQMKEILVVKVKNHHACRQISRGYSQSHEKPSMIRLLCSKQQIFRLSILGADNEYPPLLIPEGEVTIPNNVAGKHERA